MKSIKLITNILLLSFIVVLMFSCKKEKDNYGGTLKLLTDNNGVKKTNVVIQSTTQTIDLIEIKRDSASAESLNKSITIVLKDNAALIADFNIANGTNIKALPVSFFSVDPSSSHTGDTWTITMQPGEISKLVSIIIPAAASINFNDRYAFAFTIVSSDGNTQIPDQFKNGMIILSPQNLFSGRYRITGQVIDVLDTSAINPLPYWDAYLQAVSADTCILYPLDLGEPTHLIQNKVTGNLSSYSLFGMKVIFDKITDSVINVINFYGEAFHGGSGAPGYSATNTRKAELDKSGQSWYDPTSQDIKIKYLMYQPSVVLNGPRVYFDEFWKYLGP